jgi:hypothetical protein
MGYMQQLQRISDILPECSIVPNTLDMALQLCKDGQAILKASAPFLVLHVNDAWTRMNGHTQRDAEGVPFAAVLRSFEFQNDSIHQLAQNCSRGSPGSSILMVHNWEQANRTDGHQLSDEEKTPLVLYVKLLPLTSDSDAITHILAVIIDLPLTSSEANSLVKNRLDVPKLQPNHVHDKHKVHHTGANKSIGNVNDPFVDASRSIPGNINRNAEQLKMQQCESFQFLLNEVDHESTDPNPNLIFPDQYNVLHPTNDEFFDMSMQQHDFDQVNHFQDIRLRPTLHQSVNGSMQQSSNWSNNGNTYTESASSNSFQYQPGHNNETHGQTATRKPSKSRRESKKNG